MQYNEIRVFLFYVKIVIKMIPNYNKYCIQLSFSIYNERICIFSINIICQIKNIKN